MKHSYNKYKTVILSILCILSVTILLNNISAKSNENTLDIESKSFPVGNLKGDFSIEAQKDTFEAGNTANFNVYLKVTGSKTIFEDAKLELNLPKAQYLEFKQNLSELAIANVTPVLNNDKTKLTWNFEKLYSGHVSKVILKINTSNGFTPNNSEVSIDGEFFASNLFDAQGNVTSIKESAKVNIESNNKVALTNKFLGVSDSGFQVPKAGEEGIWSFSISVPKLVSGSKYVQEGSKISVVYTIDSNQAYVGVMDGTLEPKSVVLNTDNSTTLTWEIDAPSYDQQSKEEKNFFNQIFEIKTKVNDTTEAYTLLKNKIESSVMFFDSSEKVDNSLDANVAVTIQNQSEISSDGQVWAIGSRGPKDSVGGTGGSSNLDITAYDGALLGFGITPTMASYDHGEYGPTQYDIYYSVDDHLDLDRIYTGAFYYSPNSNVEADVLPLQTPAVYDIYVKYGYKNNQDEEYTLLYSDVTEKKWITNINANKHISEIKISFHKNAKSWLDQDAIPAGMFGRNLNFYFTVEKGYVGRVENVIKDIEIGRGVDRDGFIIGKTGGVDGNPWPESWKKFWGPHSANIVPVPEGETKVGIGSIELEDTNGNVVTPGKNRVILGIKNDNASIENIEGPIFAYTLLPAGISLENEASTQETYKISSVSKNFNNTGRELVKVEWSSKKLLPSYSLVAALNVIVDEKVPSDIILELSLFPNTQDFSVPKISGTELITDSYKTKDEYDFNGNGNKSEYTITTGNRYLANNKDILDVQLLAKGNIDKSFSLNASANPQSNVDYKINLKNTTNDKVAHMILISTLPEVGDRSLTTNENRDSQFSMQLTKAITIPKQWQGKVDITYSEVAIPKVAGILDQNTKYPANSQHLVDADEAVSATWLKANQVKDWTKIKSFKIESKTDLDWIAGRNIVVSYTLKTPNMAELPSNLIKSKAVSENKAYTSFAIATNNSQVVEPNQVGVEIKEKIDDKETTTDNQKVDNNKKKLSQTGSNSSMIVLICILISTSMMVVKARKE